MKDTGLRDTGEAVLEKRRILVAEDEYMIAEEVVTVLRNAGADVLGPVASFAAVIRLVAAEEQISGALLDVNLRGEAIWPAVDALRARGIPVVLTTGYDAAAIPAAYSSLPRCEKPAAGHELIRVLSRVCADLRQQDVANGVIVPAG